MCSLVSGEETDVCRFVVRKRGNVFSLAAILIEVICVALLRVIEVMSDGRDACSLVG